MSQISVLARLTGLVHRILIVFLVLFMAWILCLARHYLYLTLSGLFLVAFVLYRFVPSIREKLERINVSRLLDRSREVIANIKVSTILWTALLLRLLWSLYYNPIPFADFDLFYKQALEFAEGNYEILGLSKTPVSIIYYGSLFTAVPHSLLLVYFANGLVGILQTYLVYRISLALFDSKGAAKFSALAVALMPSLVMFNSVVSSELPYTTIMLLLLFTSSRALCMDDGFSLKKILLLAILMGTITAALHLTRNLGFLIGLWFIIVVVMYGRFRVRRKTAFCLAYLVWMFICLIPQIKYNYDKYGVFSIQSSQWGSLVLLHGTNRQTDGTWSIECIDRVRKKYDLRGKSLIEGSRYARELAREHIMNDPLDFLAFALTRKFRRMWCDDEYGAFWSLRHTEAYSKTEEGGKSFRVNPPLMFWRRVSTPPYFGIIFLALLTLISLGYAKNLNFPLFTFAAGLVALSFTMHIFIEVQGRYHYYATFLFCIMAGGFLAVRSAKPTVR